MNCTLCEHTSTGVPVSSGKQTHLTRTNQHVPTTQNSNAGLSNGGVILPHGSSNDPRTSLSNVGSRVYNNDAQSSGSINESGVSLPKTDVGSTTFKIVPKRTIESAPTYTVHKKFRLDPGVTIYANGSCHGPPPPDKPVSWDEYMKYLDTFK